MQINYAKESFNKFAATISMRILSTTIMKKASWILLLLPFFAFRCEKDTDNNCFKGKVVRITCASYVIQVLSADIGDDQWTDSMGTGQNTYDNVFQVSNKCDIPDTFKSGDTLYFDLNNPDPPNRNNCVVCMMYDAPPQAKFRIKNISTTPCQ